MDKRLREAGGVEDIVVTLEGMLADSVVFARVAIDEESGEVLAAGVVSIKELPPESAMLSEMGARDGMVKLLALPKQDEPRYGDVLGALFGEVEAWWDRQEATGANIARSVCDERFGKMLRERGWRAGLCMALRPANPAKAPLRPAPDGLEVRFAEPRDEDTVVALHLEEHGYHTAFDPTIRVVPGFERELREKLARTWTEGFEDQSEVLKTRAFVAEYRGEVVGTATAFMHLVEESALGMYALGKYAHIGSAGVRENMRGKGVGRALVEGIMRFYDELGVETYSLWYHPENPLSSRFWPGLGWKAVTTRWRRQ